MAGAGAPQSITVNAEGARVVIVASLWHAKIMSALIASAERTCRKAGAQVSVERVPGSFELPLGAARAIKAGADAVVALGVVIRGGTPHFEYVCQGVTAGLMRVSLDTDTPIGFGVLTCDDEAQALDRAGLPGSNEDKGAEAALAALALI